MRPILATVLLLAAFVAPMHSDAAECTGPKPWRTAAAAATHYSDAELKRFHGLSKKMHDAYVEGNSDAAKSFAEDYLSTASRFPCDWDYGNAIHNANAVLGLLALHHGNKALAVAQLSAAAATPGSSQLDSFGPSLLLAHELAEAGAFAPVAGYLSSIRRFWKASDRSIIGTLLPYFGDADPIASWIQTLNEGKVPNFGAPFNSDPP